MSAQAVLFDAPGPRARRRNLVLTVVGVLLALAILWAVVAKMSSAGQLEPAMWTPFLDGRGLDSPTWSPA